MNKVSRLLFSVLVGFGYLSAHGEVKPVFNFTVSPSEFDYDPYVCPQKIQFGVTAAEVTVVKTYFDRSESLTLPAGQSTRGVFTIKLSTSIDSKTAKQNAGYEYSLLKNGEYFRTEGMSYANYIGWRYYVHTSDKTNFCVYTKN